MKIAELSKELNITNKELIEFLNSEELMVAKSHLQNIPDDIISVVKKKFTPIEESSVKDSKKEKKSVEHKTIVADKKYSPDDMIPCKSNSASVLVMIGVDKTTVYRWNSFGDVEYVAYKDLQSWRRKSIIREGKLAILDDYICNLWDKEIGEFNKYFKDIEYPEEFFEYPDDKFEKILQEAPSSVIEVIKTTAMSMIHNTNYPTVQKITLMDSILGTCIKDFL